MLIDRRWRTTMVWLIVACAMSCISAPSAGDEPAKLANIVIVATGGTIAGVATSSTETEYKAAKVGIESLIAAVPGLSRLANVSGEQVFQAASPDITTEQWLTLAKRVNALLARADVDGVVITHGTDTLEETAYFLDLVVKSSKPVIFVGAMRPSTAISADGPVNIYNAVALAASAEARGKGVLVMLNDRISDARDVTKTDTHNVDTFRNWELGFLGYMLNGTPHFYRASMRKHTNETEFDIANLDSLPEVDIVYGHVAVKPAAIEALIAAGCKAIVYAGVGEGSVARPAMQNALGAARKKGVIIVRSNRVGNGVVLRSEEQRDDELDFVAADSLNPQKARILVMLALTKTMDTKRIQQMFYTY